MDITEAPCAPPMLTGGARIASGDEVAANWLLEGLDVV